MKQKGFVPALVLILVALVAAAVYFAMTKKLLKFHTPSPTSTPSVAEETADWKTYENLSYRIRFKYPPEYTIEELSNLGPNYMQINILGQGNLAQAIFSVKTSFGIEETASFVGSSPKEQKTIGEFTWYYFEFPQGYSNSPPFTVYLRVLAGFLYTFKFYNVVTNDTRDLIMTTLEILPPPQH